MSVRARLEREESLRNGTPIPAGPVVTAPASVLDGEQDPSMPGRPTVAVPSTAAAAVASVPAEIPLAPVTEVPAVPVVEEVPEQRYEWQPTDDMGKPMGGRQVILYRTEQEKFEKMQEKSVLLLRQLRKERREKAIGVPEEANDAEKFENVVEFRPRELTVDERFKLAQGLVNPETFVDARDSLIESVFGAKPEVVASTLNETQKFLVRQRAVQNYIEFVNASGFVDSLENRELVTSWLGTRNLAPTVANFVIAQKRLSEAGLLQEVPAVHQEPVVPTPAPPAAVVPPTVVEEPKPQVPAVPAPRIESVEQPQAKRHSHVPSGLTPSVASSAGESPAVGPSLTLADIDKLPSEEYKRRLKDPAFFKLVNELENAAIAKRRAKALGQ
jgi:hypothetical protein